MSWTNAQTQEVRRVFRRLCEAQSYLAPLAPPSTLAQERNYGVFVKRNRWSKPVMKLSAEMQTLFTQADLLEHKGKETYVASAAGKSLYKRMQAQAEGVAPSEAYQAQHQLRQKRANGVQTAQTPLDWIKARNDSGSLRLTDDEFVAAERLQADYALSGLQSRMTIDWNRPIVQEGGGGEHLTEAMLDARQRLNEAMRYVGAGLREVVLAVCCELVGLEEVEQRFGWPRRSAKLALKFALTRLAEFYATHKRR